MTALPVLLVSLDQAKTMLAGKDPRDFGVQPVSGSGRGMVFHVPAIRQRLDDLCGIVPDPTPARERNQSSDDDFTEIDKMLKMSPRDQRERALNGNGSGNIYFVRSGKFVKIGFAKNIKLRLSHLQTGNPFPMKLMLVVGGTIQQEKRLHQRFFDDSYRAEWFYLTNKIQNAMIALHRGSSVEDIITGHVEALL